MVGLASLPPIPEIWRLTCADDGGHGRNIEAKEAAANDLSNSVSTVAIDAVRMTYGDGRNDVNIPTDIHIHCFLGNGRVIEARIKSILKAGCVRDIKCDVQSHRPHLGQRYDNIPRQDVGTAYKIERITKCCGGEGGAHTFAGLMGHAMVPRQHKTTSGLVC